MNLHRAERLPEWHDVPSNELNRWQRLAVRTDGWITPGNGVTALGNVLAFGGMAEIANGNVTSGLIAVAAGRAADLVDGYTAHKTGTKGPKGEAFDAGFDKLQALGFVATAVAADLAPLPVIAALGAQQAGMAGFSILAKKRGHEIHPTRQGKHATFAMWGSALWFAFSKVTHGDVALGFETSAIVSTATALYLGGQAIVGYAHDAAGHNEIRPSEAPLPLVGEVE